MQHQPYTKPFYIFFLMLPSGVSAGFVTVTLPFLLTGNGFPVATTAGIVAIGLSANVYRFLWGPIVDISLSLRKWFVISLLVSIAALLLLCFTPFTIEGALWLTVIVFLSQVAATFMILPVNGFMAQCIKEHEKGKASGWYQAGSLAGTGLGGGAGLWIAIHYSAGIAGIVLCLASLLFAVVIFLVKDVPHVKDRSIAHEIRSMGKDILVMLKTPVALFAIFLIAMPIGSGAVGNLWSAVAEDWHTDAETVILITGILSGLVSAVGCVAGGYIADRWGVWYAYLGCGVVCAVVAFLMAMMPFVPLMYLIGVLAYAFSVGMVYAAYTAVILYAIGKRHVATKFSLLASLGNIPVVYMTAFDGWVHDRFDSKMMLIAEAGIGMLFVVVFWVILRGLRIE